MPKLLPFYFAGSESKFRVMIIGGQRVGSSQQVDLYLYGDRPPEYLGRLIYGGNGIIQDLDFFPFGSLQINGPNVPHPVPPVDWASAFYPRLPTSPTAVQSGLVTPTGITYLSASDFPGIVGSIPPGVPLTGVFLAESAAASIMTIGTYVTGFVGPLNEVQRSRYRRYLTETTFQPIPSGGPILSYVNRTYQFPGPVSGRRVTPINQHTQSLFFGTENVTNKTAFWFSNGTGHIEIPVELIQGGLSTDPGVDLEPTAFRVANGCLAGDRIFGLGLKLEESFGNPITESPQTLEFETWQFTPTFVSYVGKELIPAIVPIPYPTGLKAYAMAVYAIA